MDRADGDAPRETFVKRAFSYFELGGDRPRKSLVKRHFAHSEEGTGHHVLMVQTFGLFNYADIEIVEDR